MNNRLGFEKKAGAWEKQRRPWWWKALVKSERTIRVREEEGSLSEEESGGEEDDWKKRGKRSLRRGAGWAEEEACNGSLGGGQVRTEEVDEDRWIREQMSLLNRHFQCLLSFSRVMPVSSSQYCYNNINSFCWNEHAEVQLDRTGWMLKQWRVGQLGKTEEDNWAAVHWGQWQRTKNSPVEWLLCGIRGRSVIGQSAFLTNAPQGHR